MSKSSSQLFLRGTVALTFLAISLVAQAATYRGSWDPPYGSTYPNLGFAGEGVFFVPDSCLALTGFIFDSDPCSNGGMSLVSAKVNFYDIADSGTILDTLIFAPPVPASDPVIGVFVQGNEVTGVDTNVFGPQASSLAIANFDSFYLQFMSGNMPIFLLVDTLLVTDTGAFIYPEATFCQPNSDLCYQAPDFSKVSLPGDVTYARVPEPGSLALILGALGMGYLARRRKAAA